ncbi:MAG TPA: hypothetical protein VGV60_01065 [Candidatus Polarisedimenticolia bacterium]|jgi:hypothetical protein|nr:hypothetical protein [Candidatus Polarisedimenticolia bacterium]
MTWRTYQAFLIAAALIAGFLLALPVWDWWQYGRIVSESPRVDYATPVESEAPPTHAVATVPSAGGATLAAAMVVPQVQRTARSMDVEPAVPPAPSRIDRGAEPKKPAPAAVDRPGRGALLRPPAPEGRSSSLEGGGAAGTAPPPSNTSPLVWVRSLPIQIPLIAPPVERQPPPAEAPAPETGQESSKPPEEPNDSSESGGLRVSLVPSVPTVDYGKVMSVRVVLSGGEGITSVPFHLKFDPALLEFLGARTGSAFLSSSLNPLLLASVNPERPGDLAVGLALVGDSRTLNGSGSLVVLDFRAIGRGRTELTFENSSVRGVTSEPLPAEFANTIIQVD